VGSTVDEPKAQPLIARCHRCCLHCGAQLEMPGWIAKQILCRHLATFYHGSYSVGPIKIQHNATLPYTEKWFNFVWISRLHMPDHLQNVAASIKPSASTSSISWTSLRRHSPSSGAATAPPLSALHTTLPTTVCCQEASTAV
jgi:hypothetical protein